MDPKTVTVTLEEVNEDGTARYRVTGVVRKVTQEIIAVDGFDLLNDRVEPDVLRDPPSRVEQAVLIKP